MGDQHHKRDTNRFCTNQSASNPTIAAIKSRWVNAYECTAHIQNDYYRENFCDMGPTSLTLVETFQSLFGVDIEKKKVKNWSIILEAIVDESIRTDHQQYLHACELIYQYRETKRIEPLLRLYTLDTNFYTVMSREKEKTKSLLTALQYHLSTISSRAFEGYCYRGLTMEPQDLEPYRWSLENEKCHLATCTFWSTSIDQEVARAFASDGQQLEQNLNRVIIVFHFTYPCSTAIALFQQPCLSYFEDEREVLILPGTVFRVTRINKDDEASLFEVYVEQLDVREELSDVGDFIMQSRWDDLADNFTDS
ncbi:unnamed protein product [Rotaria magnacalcarata]|uniref:Mono(ADP-ribosyl)transferase n=2 Tax=Rotaria magnacalcarata TaxID=392030 RepID=A0A816DZK9_9BILA|nr:unnamed protein product [Rotaria magnacalcarata]